jgi:type II secretory pathway pseudopilin PulG
MRQINVLLIFSFGLVMVTFTLHVLPGLKATLPLAALLLVVGGIGTTAAWVFSVWTAVVKKVKTLQEQGAIEAQQVRIQELENDLQRYRHGGWPARSAAGGWPELGGAGLKSQRTGAGQQLPVIWR